MTSGSAMAKLLVAEGYHILFAGDDYQPHRGSHAGGRPSTRKPSTVPAAEVCGQPQGRQSLTGKEIVDRDRGRGSGERRDLLTAAEDELLAVLAALGLPENLDGIPAQVEDPILP